MLIDSATDAVKIGLEYILLAIFLMFVIRTIELRDDYAKALNDQKTIEQSSKETLEFSIYNTGNDQNNKDETLPADELIACIRNYRNGDISIYVDDIGGQAYTFDSIAAASEEKSIKERFTQKWLTNHLDMQSYYHPYLIYDNQDVSKAENYNKKGDSITGIAFIKFK